jgi:hypothetical protein
MLGTPATTRGTLMRRPCRPNQTQSRYGRTRERYGPWPMSRVKFIRNGTTPVTKTCSRGRQ